MSTQETPIGELLLRAGHLTDRLLQKALARQRLMGGLLGTNLIELGAVDEEELLHQLGLQQSAPTVSRAELMAAPAHLIRKIPVEIVREYQLVPYRLEGNTLLLASPRLLDLAVEEALSSSLSVKTRSHLALELRIYEAMHRHYDLPVPERYQAVLRELSTEDPLSPFDTQDLGSLSTDALRALSPADTEPIARITLSDSGSQAASQGADESLWRGLNLDAVLERIGPDKPTKTPARRIRDTVPQDQARDTAPVAQVPAANPPAPAQSALETLKPSASELLPTVGLEHLSSGEIVTQPIETIPPPSELQPDVSDPSTKRTGEQQLDPILRAAQALGEVTAREQIAQEVLGAAGHFFHNRLLLASRSGRIIGWKGAGEALVPLRVHTLNFEAHESPIFVALQAGSPFWLGALIDNPIHERISQIFGGAPPRDCVVLQIRMRDRTVAYLYADNASDSVAGTPIGRFDPLLDATAQALERYLLVRRQARTREDGEG